MTSFWTTPEDLTNLPSLDLSGDRFSCTYPTCIQRYPPKSFMTPVVPIPETQEDYYETRRHVDAVSTLQNLVNTVRVLVDFKHKKKLLEEVLAINGTSIALSFMWM
jgi:hypothetical protein